MPKLHMTFETVAHVRELMAKDQETMDKRLQDLTNAVRGLEAGDWVGNSASQFFQDYETQYAAWKRQMEIMRFLAERLKQEIEEWVHADSELNIPFLS